MRRFYGWSFAGTIAIPLVLALALVTWLTFDLVYRVSAGASLLWNSPLGPLRADFGWALQKEVYDQTQVFRFGASTKF